MKQEAFNSVKIQLLGKDLGLCMSFARGVADSLWMAVAGRFPDGIIQWDAEELAMAIGYEGDEEKLLATLIKRRFLEPTGDGRFWVHDWTQHCNDFVHAKLAKAVELFGDGSCPRIPHDSFNQATRARIRAAYIEKFGIDPDKPPECPTEVRDQSGTNPGTARAIPKPKPFCIETSSKSCAAEADTLSLEPADEVQNPGKKPKRPKGPKPLDDVEKRVVAVLERLRDGSARNCSCEPWLSSAGSLRERFRQCPVGERDDLQSLCELIVDHRCSEWKDDEVMRKHLNAETIFRPIHWDSYRLAAEEWDESGRPPPARRTSPTRAIVPGGTIEDKANEIMRQIYERTG